MCLGAILWSGIKEVYYSVPSDEVENITGFDEGFKPHWFREFKKRKVVVCGDIAVDTGEEVLEEYTKEKHTIYKPKRK
jgi:tRNA(Arg) A34 adenosine deaminase TadA